MSKSKRKIEACFGRYPTAPRPKPADKSGMKFRWRPWATAARTHLDGTAWETWMDHARCEHVNQQTGQRCRRWTVIGLHWCWQHLKIDWSLRIGNATVAAQGKGLFAVGPPNQVIFHPGDFIAHYDGRFVTKRDMNIYGDNHTAPYAIYSRPERNQNGVLMYPFRRYEDAYFHRGLGSMVNHRPQGQANAELVIGDMSPHILQEAVRQNNNAPINVSYRHSVIVRCTRNIYGGDEIFVDYGNEYGLNDPAEYSTK